MPCYAQIDSEKKVVAVSMLSKPDTRENMIEIAGYFPEMQNKYYNFSDGKFYDNYDGEYYWDN